MKTKLLIEEDKDIYTEEGVLEAGEADEINMAEEGFMIGYLSA